jgi:hypothetical protein
MRVRDPEDDAVSSAPTDSALLLSSRWVDPGEFISGAESAGFQCYHLHITAISNCTEMIYGPVAVLCP